MTSRGLCRDCFAWSNGTDACPDCGSPRMIRHRELADLTIAHLDCDAFYASVEKRDNPELVARPVIVGGSTRGVVSTACYLARIRGVHSAMPMARALAACPDAVVLRPDMERYAAVGRQIREIMRETAPLVEPLSIDEAFLDLGGTELLHRSSPAETLARLAARIESEIGVSVSIGLSCNKFLAKVASDLDKPRGMSVIGQSEAPARLAPMPVSVIWGVGRQLDRALRRSGISTVGDLQKVPEAELVRRYGAIGSRLAACAWGRDDRTVDPSRESISVSSETTFETDLREPELLVPVLWSQCETVSRRLKEASRAGRVVMLKLRTSTFRTVSRRATLTSPTQLADTLFRAARPLLERETDGRSFRLLGVGVTGLADEDEADLPDLADPSGQRRKRAEQAMDAVRTQQGPAAIIKGRSLSRNDRQ